MVDAQMARLLMRYLPRGPATQHLEQLYTSCICQATGDALIGSLNYGGGVVVVVLWHPVR